MNLKTGLEQQLQHTFALENEEVHVVAEGGTEVGAILYQVTGETLPVEVAHRAGTGGAKTAEGEPRLGENCHRDQGPRLPLARYFQWAEFFPTPGSQEFSLLGPLSGPPCPNAHAHWLFHLPFLAFSMSVPEIFSLVVYIFIRPHAHP